MSFGAIRGVGNDHLFRTSLVEALSGRGMRVRALSADNLSLGAVVPWSPAVSRTPYVVGLSNENGRFGTIALDFDAKRGRAGDAAEDANLVLGLFQTAHMPAVMARSGPAGGRHIFVAVAGFGLTLDAARALVRRLGALGFETLDPSCMGSLSACIRPPGAPHRLGGRSEVVGDPAAALDRLRRDHPDAANANDLHEFIDALAGPDDMRHALRRPEAEPAADGTERTFASGSELLQSYTTTVVARGGGLPELELFLAGLPADDDALRHLAEKSARARDKALRLSIRSAVRHLAENPAAYQQRVDDDAVIAAWQQYDWVAAEAPLGPVAVALLARARTYGRRLIGVSTRALALETACSAASARRGLARALDTGLLELADAGRGPRARRYRLNPPELWDAALHDSVGPSPVKGGVRMPTASAGADPATILVGDVGAEVWCSEALGHKMRLVYLALVRLTEHGDPASTAAVAERLGKRDRQARDDLRLLARVGLAHDLGRAGWVSEYRDPRQVTDALGVTGIIAERRRQYAREQRAHALGIIEYRLGRKFGDRQSDLATPEGVDAAAHLGLGAAA